MADNEEDKKEQEPTVEYMECPCCKKPTLERPVKPKDELVDHWLTCMLTATPFSHTYPMYNGRIDLTVTCLSQQDDVDSALFASLLDRLALDENLVNKLNLNVIQLKAMFNICLSIPTVTIKTGKDGGHVFALRESAKAALAELADVKIDILAGSEVPDIDVKLVKVVHLLTSPECVTALPTTVLVTTVEMHNQINALITNSGFDKNFWDGIALA